MFNQSICNLCCFCCSCCCFFFSWQNICISLTKLIYCRPRSHIEPQIYFLFSYFSEFFLFFFFRQVLFLYLFGLVYSVFGFMCMKKIYTKNKKQNWMYDANTCECIENDENTLYSTFFFFFFFRVDTAFFSLSSLLSLLPLSVNRQRYSLHFFFLYFFCFFSRRIDVRKIIV